jgi:hypothetical protein
MTEFTVYYVARKYGGELVALVAGPFTNEISAYGAIAADDDELVVVEQLIQVIEQPWLK